MCCLVAEAVRRRVCVQRGPTARVTRSIEDLLEFVSLTVRLAGVMSEHPHYRLQGLEGVLDVKY